jgi:glutamate synthase (NADPH/NADH) small chain
MGKLGGFVEWTRIVPKKRAIAERVRDWREVDGAADPEETRRQAGRCMDCGVPFCHRGCPLGNPIPEFADLVWKDRWAEAHRRLAESNEMPEMTGRLCPAPCEASCVLAMPPRDAAPLPDGAPPWGAPVTIEALEKAIAERAFAEGWVVPRPPRARTGKRVAIVGAGPAGLAAAARLNRAGHAVVVYEAAARAGGLLRYGIPDFKLEKHVIDRRLAVLEAEGVELRLGVAVGRDPTWDRLRAEHDAVLIAIGAARPRELDVPGRDLAGVLLAMDYLVDQNETVAGARPAAVHDVRGQHVIILGGGDTGSDCLGTALRQGAASVAQIELMPAPPDARASGNAWPAWPLVMRTSSSQEEGGAREFAFRTTHLEGEPGAPGTPAPGRLVALHGVRVALDGGRLVDLPDSALRLPCDRLILALGFTGPDAAPLAQQLGVALDDRRNVRVDGSFATTAPGVFCAGDAHRGASLIVWALAEGRDAAAAIDAYLRQR